LLLLAELGFGLDLGECVVTGTSDDLAYVSPKSGGAVSTAAAAGYESRLLRLPPFLRNDRPDGTAAEPTMTDVIDFLALTGHFLVPRRARRAQPRLADGKGKIARPAQEGGCVKRPACLERPRQTKAIRFLRLC